LFLYKKKREKKKTTVLQLLILGIEAIALLLFKALKVENHDDIYYGISKCRLSSWKITTRSRGKLWN